MRQGLRFGVRLTRVMRMDTSDENLAKAAGEGDADAFSALLARHYDRIYRVAFRVLGTVAEAEDVTQDVCMGLARKLQGFRGDARFTTWLHSVTVNAARDHIRRSQTQAKAADGWGDVELNRRAVAVETAEAQDWLMETLTRLNPALRETVALVLGEDLNHAEAGEALGVSEGTISWRMSEVKKSLAAFAREEEMLK